MKGTSQTLLLAALVLFIPQTHGMFAGDQPVDSMAIVAQALKLEDLRGGSIVPFALQAGIKVESGKREIPGQYSLNWWAPNHWREILALGDFQRNRVGVDGGYNQVRSVEYQPQAIFDIDKILDWASSLRITAKETVSKTRRRKIAGMELSCVQVSNKKYVTKELCFDLATGLLLHAEFSELGTPASARSTVDYSGIISLGDRKFPSKVTFKRGGGFSMEVSITLLQSDSESANAAPIADPHSEFWPDCRGSAPAEALTMVQPRYPMEAKQRGEQGIVSFYARIEADGTLSHMKILQSSSPSLEQSAREAVMQWTYKPRTCDGAPVKDETIIDVAYTLQR